MNSMLRTVALAAALSARLPKLPAPRPGTKTITKADIAKMIRGTK